MEEEKLDVILQRAVSMGLNCDAGTLGKLRQVPLLYLARMMGKYLTYEKHITEALSVLSLATAKRENLQDDEAVVVLKFFSGKLSSLQTVETSVECIARVIEALSTQRPCSENVFAELAHGFLANVRFQALPTNVRRSGFKIINYMLSEASAPWLTTPVLRLLLEAMDAEGEPELVAKMFEFSLLYKYLCG
ncbi:putative folate/biopterin transporter [Trypanosoma conorhini]|uniref:Putative folate/biopterin transporter n=1 Tax=Trypanosoma conorhini TaxID=83891 RepID=A0A3R7N4M8_9TRYP|nr:putative folate/biopterin transporter [Trypanosoma conorhini]RNF12698.1 putative folate/biopterin transporter [Trypanosoma conorhini]